MTTAIHLEAFAALVLDGDDVGTRVPCVLTFKCSGIDLDREIVFDPPPHDGQGSVSFYRDLDGLEPILEINPANLQFSRGERVSVSSGRIAEFAI